MTFNDLARQLASARGISVLRAKRAMKIGAEAEAAEWAAARAKSQQHNRTWHKAPDGTDCCCTEEERRYGMGCY
jgi:hypothetical protein